MPFTKKSLTIHSLQFAVIDEGSGPSVLLLHGFPDSSELWRHQIPAFVKAGYRVIAPDLRGFGDSDKPEKIEDYQLPKLVNDVLGMLDALSIDRAHVIAHDWGAVVGWLMAAMHPNRMERFVALSVGHPSIFTDFTTDQLEKSWYILFFQFQGIAEQMLQKNDWALFKEWSRHHPEHEKWLENMSRPGALAAALNWYRANMAPQALPAMPLQIPPIRVPTLGIWSSGDVLLTEEQMKRSGEKVIGEWQYEKMDASHWIPLDKPDELNALILNFFRKS